MVFLESSELWTFEHPKREKQKQLSESFGTSHTQSSSTIHDTRDVSLPIFHQFVKKQLDHQNVVSPMEEFDLGIRGRWDL